MMSFKVWDILFLVFPCAGADHVQDFADNFGFP